MNNQYGKPSKCSVRHTLVLPSSPPNTPLVMSDFYHLPQSEKCSVRSSRLIPCPCLVSGLMLLPRVATQAFSQCYTPCSRRACVLRPFSCPMNPPMTPLTSFLNP